MIPPILISYAYFKGPLGEFCQRALDNPNFSVLVDSGAFTVHRSGDALDLKEYMDFCKSIHGRPGLYGYIQLDSVGNRDITTRNLETMVNEGLRPMPVLTVDMPLERLPGLVSVNPRVCIAGGLGAFDGVKDWILARYRRAGMMCPEAKIHGLGYVRWPQSFQSGIASADSSSHSAGGRYGLLSMFDRGIGIKNIFWKKAPKTAWVKERLLPAMGLTLDDVHRLMSVKPIHWHENPAWASSVYSSTEMAIHATKRLNVKIFLAIAEITGLAYMAGGFRHRTPDRLALRFYEAMEHARNVRSAGPQAIYESIVEDCL